MGSTEYKTAMENVNMLDRMMKEMLEDKTIEGRMEKIDRIREQMNTIDANIDAYKVRSDKKKSLDAKAQRRKDTLLNVKNSLKDLRFAMDDKEIELNALEAANETKKMQGEMTRIDGLKTMYETEISYRTGILKISAQGSKTALESLNTLANKTTGETGFGEKEAASAKKCIGAMFLHEMLASEEGSSIRNKLDEDINKIKENIRLKNLPETQRKAETEKEITKLYTEQVKKIVNSAEFKEILPEKTDAEKLHTILVDMADDKKTYKQFRENISKTAKQKKNAEADKKKTNTVKKKAEEKKTTESKKEKGTKPQMKGGKP
jgi:hypothetical protein